MHDNARPAEPDDTELVRRYQAGDADACTALLTRHQDRLFRLALGWLANPNDAEDAVQEVFIRALKGLSAFRFRAAPATWFYRTCRLVCHEHNRRRRHEPIDREPAAPGFDPAEFEQRRQVHAKVHAALDGLTDRQRDVVLLRKFEDLSVRETAAIMRCREGTVKALLHKAMAALRREVTP